MRGLGVGGVLGRRRVRSSRNAFGKPSSPTSQRGETQNVRTVGRPRKSPPTGGTEKDGRIAKLIGSSLRRVFELRGGAVRRRGEETLAVDRLDALRNGPKRRLEAERRLVEQQRPLPVALRTERRTR